jgi:hypothetical protein
MICHDIDYYNHTNRQLTCKNDIGVTGERTRTASHLNLTPYTDFTVYCTPIQFGLHSVCSCQCELFLRDFYACNAGIKIIICSCLASGGIEANILIKKYSLIFLFL